MYAALNNRAEKTSFMLTPNFGHFLKVKINAELPKGARLNADQDAIRQQIIHQLIAKKHINSAQDVAIDVSKNQDDLIFMWGNTKDVYDKAFTKPAKQLPLPPNNSGQKIATKLAAYGVTMPDVFGLAQFYQNGGTTLPIGRSDFAGELDYMANISNLRNKALSLAKKTAIKAKQLHNLTAKIRIKQNGQTKQSIADDSLRLFK